MSKPDETLLPEQRGLRDPVWLVLILGFIAFVVLSRYLLVAPDTVVTLRNNVLFETDSGVRLRYLTDPMVQPHRLEFAQHPAFFLVWRPITLALEWLLAPVAGAGAAVLSVQLLVCASAAVAAAFTWRLARRHGASSAVAAALTIVFILNTASVLLVVPEHWAMAAAMMIACFYAISAPGALTPRRLFVIGVLAVLIAGTTVTNAAFGALLLATWLRRSPWRRAERAFYALALAGAIVMLIAIGPRLVRMPAVAGFFNLRLIEAPLQAAVYTVFAFVAPVIGPVPYRTFERAHVVLSYEPVSFAMYEPLQWLGVAAWVILFAGAAAAAVANAKTRPWLLWLLGWCAFNLLFHNLWGDEFFLYSPHWSWALAAVVALGAARLRWPVIAAAALPLVIAQLYTFTVIGQLLKAP